MKPYNPKPGFRPRHTLGLLAAAGALGAIATALPSAAVPASSPLIRLAQVNGGKPQVAVFQLPKGPNAPAPPVVTAPSLLTREVLGPTDRCVIEAPQVDEPFVHIAPQVDDRYFVKPLVQGLPVSTRAKKK